jgi:hypothetical protein
MKARNRKKTARDANMLSLSDPGGIDLGEVKIDLIGDQVGTDHHVFALGPG